MVIGERIQSLLDEQGMSQSELGRRVGVSQAAIAQLIKGRNSGSKHLHAIAKELKTTTAYLSNETEDPSLPDAVAEAQRGYSPPPAELAAKREKSNLVEVREIDLKFGMGTTYLDEPATMQVREFNREWLRQYSNASPDDLFFAQGIGDSMQPTLMTSDLLLIDTSQNTIRQADHIWAVAYANCGSIKRLRPMPDGGVKILSDNPSVPEEIAYDGELQIIGRVVGVFRKI